MGTPMYSMEDVRMTLHGTVCIHKGEPVYVSVEREGGDLVTIQPVGSRSKPQVVKYTSDDFDYRSPSLGYMYFMGRAYYVQRTPERRNKQGLHPDHLQAHDPQGGSMMLHDVYASHDCFANCVKGIHMTEKEAMELLLMSKAHSVPISRYIAIGRIDYSRTALYYRNRMVGTKYNDAHGYTLLNGEDASFMRRILEKQVTIC